MNNDQNPTKPDLLDSAIIKPRRSYKCTDCNRMCSRKDVGKSPIGIHYCLLCGGIVVDVTDTTTGHDFLEILNV